MSSFIEPLVGLVWISSADPTVGPGVSAPLWQFLIRTDDMTLYYKSGTATTDWTPLGGGGGTGGVNVEDNETPILSPATTLNFVGNVVVTDAGGGVARVAIGGLGGLGIQVYRYVATGTEDPTGFPIPLQTGRSNNSYNAVAALGDTINEYAINCPPASYTTTQFTCVTGTQPKAGDILLITIIPLT